MAINYDPKLLTKLNLDQTELLALQYRHYHLRFNQQSQKCLINLLGYDFEIQYDKQFETYLLFNNADICDLARTKIETLSGNDFAKLAQQEIDYYKFIKDSAKEYNLNFDPGLSADPFDFTISVLMSDLTDLLTIDMNVADFIYAILHYFD